jgi:pyrroline-5-carboxylate reductase
MLDAIGFIGVGNIASAVIEALETAPGQPPPVLLSPRNTVKSAALAQRFPAITVAADNQGVLDGSTTVFLSLRPQVVAEVLHPLRFAPRHTVVSLIPLPVSSLAPLIDPARCALRALLLPTCTQRVQAVPYWPETPAVSEVLARLGTPLPLREERELDVLWASTAVISAFYALLETVSAWSVRRGVAPAVAVNYTAGMACALTRAALSGGPDPFGALAAEAATPGGLNEQVLRILRAGGAYTDLQTALDAVLARISPRPVE